MYIYCLIHSSSSFVINRDTMHVKCRILRLKNMVFSVTGTCNLTGRYQGCVWTQCLHLLTDCEDRPRLLLHKSHNHVHQLYTVLTQTTLWILTTVSTSYLVAKNIKNWSVDGNFTLGKLNYRRAVHFLQI